MTLSNSETRKISNFHSCMFQFPVNTMEAFMITISQSPKTFTADLYYSISHSFTNYSKVLPLRDHSI